MVGTTVEEGGIVYRTLRQVMVNDGLSVSESEMHHWHGAKKESVIAHFAEAQGTPPGPELEKRIAKCGADFEAEIDNAYFQPGSPVSLIRPHLLTWIQDLQKKGVKVGLDTGYPPNIQVVSGHGLSSNHSIPLSCM
jgi:phosphoglycolate phosphatase